MDVIAEIRRRFHVDHETITSLAATFNLSRPTIRKHLKTIEEAVYQRQNQPHERIGQGRVPAYFSVGTSSCATAS